MEDRAPTLVACSNPACREPKLQHVACPTCGTYNRRQVLDGLTGRLMSMRTRGADDRQRRCHSSSSSACSASQLDPALLERALTHRSYAYENGGLPTNERLEFLGDSVLGLVVTDTLYRTHPDLPEGQLAKLRAAVVNCGRWPTSAAGSGSAPSSGSAAAKSRTGGRDKSSILADTLEAVIGAVYLDRRPRARPPRWCTGSSTR